MVTNRTTGNRQLVGFSPFRKRTSTSLWQSEDEEDKKAAEKEEEKEGDETQAEKEEEKEGEETQAEKIGEEKEGEEK